MKTITINGRFTIESSHSYRLRDINEFGQDVTNIGQQEPLFGDPVTGVKFDQEYDQRWLTNKKSNDNASTILSNNYRILILSI